VDETEAAETAEQFIALSLAQRDQPEGSIRLHDLQLDYLRAQCPDKVALDLIHGAVRLPSNVIATDPSQFASQIVGRLLPHQEELATQTQSTWASLRFFVRRRSQVPPAPTIQTFLRKLVEGTRAIWLRPLTPALNAPGNGLILTLEGHLDVVTALALTPDGRQVVSASQDKTLKVWDLKSGGELYTLAGHEQGIKAIAVTSDGRQVVSASWNKTLKVWDLQSKRELYTLAGDQNVVAIAVTSDGQHAISASENELKVWDLTSKCELQTWRAGIFDKIEALVVTPDGRCTVTACSNGKLKSWDLDRGCELLTLTGHTRSANAIAMTADGRRIVSGSSDNTLKVWEPTNEHELFTLVGHSRSVMAVAVTPDGHQAVSASLDRTLKVWDLRTKSEVRSIFTGHEEEVEALAITPDGRLAVSAATTPKSLVSPDRNARLKVWDLGGTRDLCFARGHTGNVTALAVTADGRRAVSASADKTLKVWDLTNGRELYTLAGHREVVTAVAVTADGQQAISTSMDTTLKVWDLSRGRELRTLYGETAIGPTSITPDGQLAVSATFYGLKVWDLAKGRELRRLSSDQGSVGGLVVSSDGQRVVSVSLDKTVKAWYLQTGEVLATFTCDSAAYCCVFSDALNLIVVGDAGGHVHFLRLEEPKRKS
jgi:WD40 repeat protein